MTHRLRRQLKALIQWIAASAAGRPLHYFTFGQRDVQQPLQDFAAKCMAAGISVRSSVPLTVDPCANSQYNASQVANLHSAVVESAKMMRDDESELWHDALFDVVWSTLQR